MFVNYPLAWGLLFLAIPIIIFFILKVKLRQERIATALFWEQVFEERRSRSFWRQLRHPLSLLIALLFLTLLTGATLQPNFSPLNVPVRCVVILDNSASMNVLLPGNRLTRLDAAKTELRKFLSKNGSRQIAMLTAGGTPKIVVGFTNHLGTLRRGLDSVMPTDSPTALKETITLAETLIESEEKSSILVYTDGCVADVAELLAKPKVRFIPVGEPVDNSAITRFQSRRSLGDVVGYEILVEMVHFGTETVQTRLEIDLEPANDPGSSRPIDVIPLTLEPNKPITKIIRSTTPDGGLLRGTLQGDDLFQTDNHAAAFLPGRPVQPIFLYGDDNFFLTQVLRSQPNIEIHRQEELSNEIPAGGVLVIHQTVPAKIPAGNVFIIDPHSSCNLFQAGSVLEKPIVARENSDSPLLKFVHLTNLPIPGARKLTFKKTDEPGAMLPVILAETPEKYPIYAQINGVLVLTADLSRGDLAFRTAFPILVAHALTQFQGSGGEMERAYSTAETVNLKLQTSATLVILRSPDGTEQTVPVKSGSISLGMLPMTGIWTVLEPDGKELTKIACNVSNVTESNLRQAPDSFYQTGEEADEPGDILPESWFWFALGALFLTTAEWFLYQRRWIE